MAYASDRYEEKRKKNELYRQAVERRLAPDSKRKPMKKNDPTEDILRRRKDTGYFGG